MKICVVSANLGRIDTPKEHIPQVVPAEWQVDYFTHDDKTNAKRQQMGPRLQAKIYRTHAHQDHPGYDYYIWLDHAFKITAPDFVKWAVDQLGDNEACFFAHPERKTVKEEIDFVTQHLPTSPYLQERYTGDFYNIQAEYYAKDPKYKDTFLIASGCFVYKPTKRMCNALQDWFYHICRWNIQDQVSLPYVLQTNKVKFGFFDAHQLNNPYIKHMGHAPKVEQKPNVEAPRAIAEAVDVVFLAETFSPKIQEMTQRAIDSLHASSRTTKFNAIVIESSKVNEPITYPQTHRITVLDKGEIELHGSRYMASEDMVGQEVEVIENHANITINLPTPKTFKKMSDGKVGPIKPYTRAKTYKLPFPFNYNKALNYAASLCNGEWFVACNNDVIFKPNWWEIGMEAVKKHSLDSFSPKCPRFDKHADLHNGQVRNGYRSGYDISGWCIAVKRSTLESIGGFDERFPFYAADDSYGMQLKRAGLKHALVADSHVEHLIAQTSRNRLDRLALTNEALAKMKECYPEWGIN